MTKPTDAITRYGARPRTLDAHLRKRSAAAAGTRGTAALVPGLIALGAGLLAIFGSRAGAEQPLLRLPGMVLGVVAGVFAADRGKRHVARLRAVQRTLKEGPLVLGRVLDARDGGPPASRLVVYDLDAARATDEEHLRTLAARLVTMQAAADGRALGTTLFEALRTGVAPRPVRVPPALAREAYVVALEPETRADEGSDGTLAFIADTATKGVIRL